MPSGSLPSSPHPRRDRGRLGMTPRHVPLILSTGAVGTCCTKHGSTPAPALPGSHNALWLVSNWYSLCIMAGNTPPRPLLASVFAEGSRWKAPYSPVGPPTGAVGAYCTESGPTPGSRLPRRLKIKGETSPMHRGPLSTRRAPPYSGFRLGLF